MHVISKFDICYGHKSQVTWGLDQRESWVVQKYLIICLSARGKFCSYRYSLNLKQMIRLNMDLQCLSGKVISNFSDVVHLKGLILWQLKWKVMILTRWQAFLSSTFGNWRNLSFLRRNSSRLSQVQKSVGILCYWSHCYFLFSCEVKHERG